jgi:hypothetical protein
MQNIVPFVKLLVISDLATSSCLNYLLYMQLISTYPKESPLSFEHRFLLQPYLLENRHSISELSMASLYPFTKKRYYTVSNYDEDHYIIRGFQENNGKKERFAILPSGYPTKELIVDLFKDVDEINTIGEHNYKEWQQKLEKDNLPYKVVEDRDNADYIYDRQSLVDLVGQALHKKMAHAKKFSQSYPNRIIVPSHLVKTEDMVEVLDQWAEGKDVVEDYNATLLAINLREELKMRGIVVFVDNKPVAFTLAEMDGEDRVITHIEKALVQYKGIFQYINRAFAKDLPSSVTEINRAQDLGIPGLRQAKLTYEPKRLLMKYKIRKD